MDCLKAEEQFSAYVEDEIDYRGIKRFESHLANCQHCRNEFALFQESVRLLQEMPPVQPSPEFDLALQVRLAETPIEPVPFWQGVLNAFRLRPAWTFGGVTALLVVLAGFYLSQNVWERPLLEDISSTPTRELRYTPSVTITRPEQPPLATPRFSQFWTIDASTGSSGSTPPQRISQNYILQTVSYTPVGGGL